MNQGSKYDLQITNFNRVPTILLMNKLIHANKIEKMRAKILSRLIRHGTDTTVVTN